ISGLQLNNNKSEIMGVGSWQDKQDFNDYGFKKVKEVKITGLYIGGNQKEVDKQNFEPIINKTRNKLAQWKGRHLSILGKIVAVKSHGLSYMQYAASIISVPKWVIQKV